MPEGEQATIVRAACDGAFEPTGWRACVPAQGLNFPERPDGDHAPTLGAGSCRPSACPVNEVTDGRERDVIEAITSTAKRDGDAHRGRVARKGAGADLGWPVRRDEDGGGEVGE